MVALLRGRLDDAKNEEESTGSLFLGIVILMKMGDADRDVGC
jgi:hypothetical protein